MLVTGFLLQEMISRGTDTVATLLEWILARMVMHPDIQARAQAKIDSVVGSGRGVKGADLPNLPYVHAIVKEILCVHPPDPLLSWPRLAIHYTIAFHVGFNLLPGDRTNTYTSTVPTEKSFCRPSYKITNL